MGQIGSTTNENTSGVFVPGNQRIQDPFEMDVQHFRIIQNESDPGVPSITLVPFTGNIVYSVAKYFGFLTRN